MNGPTNIPVLWQPDALFKSGVLYFLSVHLGRHANLNQNSMAQGFRSYSLPAIRAVLLYSPVGLRRMFLVIDRLFFDAGELLELTLATVGGYLGLLTALARYHSFKEVVEPSGR